MVQPSRNPSPAPPDYRRLFEATPAPYLVLAPDFTIVAVNDAYLRATMTVREEIVGRGLFEVFPDNPADEAATGVSNLRGSLMRVLRRKAPDTMAIQKYDIPRADAEGGFEPRYWAPLNTPVLDEAGEVSHILHWVEDVTDLVKAREHADLIEAELAAQVAETKSGQLRALLDAAPVGIIFVDADGRPRVVNAVGRDIWQQGLGADRFDQPAHWHAWWADGSERDGTALAPEDWPLARALRGEDPVRETIAIEPRAARGEVHTLDMRARPVRAQDGSIIGAVVAHTDITEQLRVQARLRESEARFRTITEVMPQIVWSTRPDGYHDYFNARYYDFTAMPEGAADGEAWLVLYHPADRERTRQTWHHSLATGEPYEIEYRLRHRSGEYRWVLGRAMPVRDERGRITRWMGTCTDIHEQVIAQEMLREGARRKDEFLAMLAHELRNPLAPIRTAAAVLPAAAGNVERTIQLGEVIARQSRHMTRLVDDLLDVSRVTRGLVKLDFEGVDLKTLVTGAIEQVRPLVEDRRHTLATWMVPTPVPVRADRTRLVQVIANLLNNAAKYTRSGGRIEVRVDVEQGEAVLSVRDNGSGIDAQLLPHVFELFTQGAHAPERAQGGLGIGLALARSITLMHGGSIVALSEGIGHGSEFVLRLPLARPLDAPAAAEPGQPAERKAGHCRIILVDDNVDAARTIALALEIAGHQVSVHHDGASAIDASRLHPAPVYILDIGLPDMSGYDLARALRRDPRTAKAVLIALTGYGRAEDRRKADEAGFDHHLTKPVDVEELRALIEGLDACAVGD